MHTGHTDDGGHLSGNLIPRAGKKQVITLCSSATLSIVIIAKRGNGEPSRSLAGGIRRPVSCGAEKR